MLKLSFLGAAQTVTGSKYLIQAGPKYILVDCGLFQGMKELRQLNWKNLPISPAKIDAVLLTHAHIDHSGYLPVLMKQGFTGPIYATQPTRDLCNILLPDSGQLQEEDARFANKHGFSKHKPALPLYTKDEAIQCMQQFRVVDFNKSYALFPNCNIAWYRAGHILGASSVKIDYYATSILFSGDIGRYTDPVMRAPADMPVADYLVLESTYGDRLHEDINPQLVLADIICQTVREGGKVIVPAFAVGRSQAILYHLFQLKLHKKIPDVPIFLDSPMAINATNLLAKYKSEHRLPQDICVQACKIASYINTPEESKKLDALMYPFILISASGMAAGGRILHHLKCFIEDPHTTVIFTGFQAPGTLGARLIAGEPKVKIHGQIFSVRAKIHMLPNSSAHADYAELLQWCKKLPRPPHKVFITHGEQHAALALQNRIQQELQWTCEVPEYLATYKL